MRGATARWLAASAVGVLAVGVGALALAAYDHVQPTTPRGVMAPAPTFTLGVSIPMATPTKQAIPADRQRLLSIGATQWWRATAGGCGAGAPLIERSSDAGASWSDVTPRYLGIERVLTLDAIASADAEVVAGAAGCSPQALRTYTRGEFWESYAEVLATSRFVDPSDPASIHLAAGDVAAPCDVASGLRAQGGLVAVLCDDHAWSWTGTSWAQLPLDGAVALAVDGSDIVVAHTVEDCEGVAVSRVAATALASAESIGCAVGTDAAQPVAIDLSGGVVVIWSGDVLATVG